ncbi:MAG TPA: hypothetical protein VMS77_09970 [Conexivisphaerales archaeon]|nr:hypothetical protein [Conexivisphaerales archaeon]
MGARTWKPLQGILNRPLWQWLIVGLVLRLALAPWFGHWYDSRIFMAVGAGVANGESPYSTYNLTQLFPGVQAIIHGDETGVLYGIGYPPLWGVITAALYEGSYATTHNLNVYMFALKLPVILGDIAFALVLARFVSGATGSWDSGDLAAKVWLVCPFVLLSGVVWGQMDILPLLFIVLSTYYLLRGNWLAGAVLLAIADGFKPLGIVILPVLAAFLWKKGSIRNAVYFTAANLLCFAALSVGLLLALHWPLGGFLASQTYQISGVIGGGSLFIVWTAASAVLTGSEPYLITPALGVLWVVAAVAVSLLYVYRNGGTDARALVFWELAAVLASFASRTFVNDPQFIVPASLFLILILLDRARTVKPFWIATGLLTLFVVVHAPMLSFPWIESTYSVDLSQSLLASFTWTLVKWLGSAAVICVTYWYFGKNLWRLRGMSRA